MPMSRGWDWGDMTFGFWLPHVKAMRVLEYLAPWWRLGLCFRDVIRTVDLILTFGVNMKVLDNFVSFPMALVSRDFLILSYDENTTSRS